MIPLPVILILLLTVAVSVRAFNPQGDWFHQLLFNAFSIRTRGQWYRFVTYGLVHADYIHLFVNMYVLWTFGSFVNKILLALHGPPGNLLFMLLYFGGLILSTLPSYFMHRNHPHYNAVGASGAVASVVFASIVMNPFMQMGILFIPFFIPAWIFGLLYLFYSYYMARRGHDRIGHDVHLFGALFGILFVVLTEPQSCLNFLKKIMP